MIGKCVEILQFFDTECPVFEINYGDELVQICNNKYSSGSNFQVGDEYKLFINPKDINDYFIYTDKFEFSTFFFIGYIAILISGTGLLFVFKFPTIVMISYCYLLLGIIFVVIFISNLKEYIYMKNHCILDINATVTDNQLSLDNDNGVRYRVIYEIVYNLKKYKLCNSIYRGRRLQEGSVHNIKINPDNPLEFIDERWNFITLITMFISGVLILILIVTFFNSIN